MELTDGFHPVPAGRIAAVVTHLEMRAPVAPRPVPDPDGVTLERVPLPDPDWYRGLFTVVGSQDWLWFSRLLMDDATLCGHIHDPRVHVYAVRRDGADLGMLELDFRDDGECELGFFGLAAPLIGGGAGRWLMNHAIALAWAAPITRFHLHTCTFDSQQAMAFYTRSGFTPTRQEVQIVPDPRLTGALPDTAAPHVPLIR